MCRRTRRGMLPGATRSALEDAVVTGARAEEAVLLRDVVGHDDDPRHLRVGFGLGANRLEELLRVGLQRRWVLAVRQVGQGEPPPTPTEQRALFSHLVRVAGGEGEEGI